MPENQFHEILDLYKSKFEPEHRKNVTEYFETLRAKSNVNPEENAKLVHEINSNQNILSRLRAKKSTNSALTIFVALAGFFICLILSLKMKNGSLSLGFIGLVVPVAVVTIVILYFLNKKRKELQKEINNVSSIIKQKTDEAYEQMKPLNLLYDSGISNELLTKTIPLLKMDKNFNIRRYDQLITKFGFTDLRENNDSSAILCQTGEINGNPFLFGRTRETYMGEASYTGQKTISWTTRDSEGNTVHHSETLTATIYKPCPYYYSDTKLYYGNDAAPKLMFSRVAGNIHNKDDKELERHIKRQGNKITKKAEKDVRKGGDLTISSNIDFEVLFNAIDRNNEQEFRLLFTPLAQNEMMKLLKNENGAGYGDNFNFNKNKKINIISSGELASADLVDNPTRYYDFDLQKAKNYFISYNMLYLKNIFFGLAPLLVIPLYQQTKTHEFIYKDVYPACYSTWQHEVVANSLGSFFVDHPEAVTENIRKTRFLDSTKNSDRFEITSYGYRTERRIEYVSKLGGDGGYHDVPVEWLEYLPVSRTTLAQVADTNMKFKEFINLEKPQIPNIEPLTYRDSTLSFVYKDGTESNDQMSALEKFFAMFDKETTQKTDVIENLIETVASGEDLDNIDNKIDD